MKQFLFANYHKEFKFYENFHVVKETKENYVTGTIRSIRLCKDNNILASIVGKELHCLACIDDETGTITEIKEVCVDYDNYLNVIKETSNVGEDSTND